MSIGASLEHVLGGQTPGKSGPPAAQIGKWTEGRPERHGWSRLHVTA